MMLPGNVMQTHDCKQEPNAFEDEVFVQFKESENTFVWLVPLSYSGTHGHHPV